VRRRDFASSAETPKGPAAENFESASDAARALDVKPSPGAGCDFIGAAPAAARRAGLPPDPTRRYGTFLKGKLSAQIEEVLVDTKDFI
jgi:hypothetical protein